MKFVKVMFLHLSVILFMGGGGLPQCILGYTYTPRTRGRHPLPDQRQTPPPRPEADTPRSRHPREQCMLGDTDKRAVRILLECILVEYILIDLSNVLTIVSKK